MKAAATNRRITVLAAAFLALLAATLVRAIWIQVVKGPEYAAMYAPTVWIDSAPAVAEVAREYLRPGDAVLVKASRAIGLEGIADEIANFARAWSPY